VDRIGEAKRDYSQSFRFAKDFLKIFKIEEKIGDRGNVQTSVYLRKPMK
jgi:hypothetical protein